MPYKISDITLELDVSKITIRTALQYYIVVPEQVIPDPPNPDIIIPAHDRIDWSKPIIASCKVDPFVPASLNAARPILVDQMDTQMKFYKRLMDKEFEIKNSGILTTLKDNIMAKLALIP